MRHGKPLLAAAALVLCVAAVAFARDGRPLYLAVKATSFERADAPKVGDAYTIDPNVTRALNALAAEGYEPILVDGGLIVGRRK